MSAGKGMGGHQSSAAITTTWLTPPHILSALGPFDLDPCTPEVMPWITAKHRYTEKDDGLTQPWFGRVWCNPPYGKEAEHFLKKLADHGDGVALIFARTETTAFFEQVWHRADALLFLRGRLHFFDQNGVEARSNAGAPSVLVAYGKSNALTLKECGLVGAYIALAGGKGKP